MTRLTIGLPFVSALFFLAASGWGAEQTLDQQIAERTKQYQESLRQRASQLSLSLQTKIETQAQQTVAKNKEKWKSGEISLRIALPRLAEAQRIAQFVSRHLPLSGSPAGSFEGKSGICDAVLTVSSVLKTVAVAVVDPTVVRSFVGLTPRNNGNISYFIRIVCTIVQRR